LKVTTIKDSLINEDVKNRIKKLIINFETEKIENENRILKITQEKQLKLNRMQKLIITIIFAFLIFALLLLLTLHKLNKKLNNAYEEIKISIEYAGKIQSAMLSSYNDILKHFREHVIFYKPAHTLSGDFYWAKKIKDTMFVAAGDSTGHGIPGALLSIAGMSYLDDNVYEDFIKPDVILNNMRNKIKYRLNQRGKLHEHKDGWDMSLISINMKNLTVSFSGAYNSLYVIKESDKTKKLIQYKADRQPVAIHSNEKPFKRHNLKLNKGDIIWMFTDGYKDQLNPETMKKFTLKRLKELLLKISDLPLKEQKDILKSEFIKWKGNYEQIDDILLLGIKI
ncbi:MAG: SpoIIE family protein phosphatase, partial [Chlorobi bacterium]|nr:SpoIIE family protein phosphatase [Chlorobiota bacterium]